jgi:hypothetical protein
MALVGHLLPLLSSSRARVTTMSSAAARFGRLDWDDLNSERDYSPVRAYNLSKLAQLMFALELDRRSKAHGWGIVSNAAHPGTTYTGLYTAGPGLGSTKPPRIDAVMRRFLGLRLFVQPVEHGLLPALQAATDPAADGGTFYGPDGIGHFTGEPARQRVYRSATDEAAAARLWAVSEEMTGVRFPDAALRERGRGEADGPLAAVLLGDETSYTGPERAREVGLIELHGQTLLDPDQYQALTVFTAVPGTESHERLRLLSVVGSV